MRSRWLIVAAVGLFATGVAVDVSCRQVRRWLDVHALTTNLISSAFFALVVSFVISRFARQREAERLKVPAREALQRLLFAARRATASLNNLIDTRAEAVFEVRPLPTQATSPLEALQTARSRELALAIHRIARAEPQWLATDFAAHAERLADLASERIVAAGPLLGFAADPDATQWAMEDAGTLRSIAAAARTIASHFGPVPREELSPLMTTLAKAAREALPTFPDDVAAAVRARIAAEETNEALTAKAAIEREAMAVEGVKSLALMIALREDIPQFLTR